MKAQAKPMASQKQVEIIEQIVCAKCDQPTAHLTSIGLTIQSSHRDGKHVSVIPVEHLLACVQILESRQALDTAPLTPV